VLTGNPQYWFPRMTAKASGKGGNEVRQTCAENSTRGRSEERDAKPKKRKAGTLSAALPALGGEEGGRGNGRGKMQDPACGKTRKKKRPLRISRSHPQEKALLKNLFIKE